MEARELAIAVDAKANAIKRNLESMRDVIDSIFDEGDPLSVKRARFMMDDALAIKKLLDELDALTVEAV